MDEEIYHKIEAYLGGDMEPEQREQFEDRMTKDIELQKEVRLFNEINHHLNTKTWLNIENQNNKSKEQLEDYIKSEEAIVLKNTLQRASERFKNSNSNASKKRYFIGAIAAIFIIGLISTIFWNQSPNANLLYDEYYTEEDLPSVVKRGSKEEQLTQGIIAFKSNDYEKSLFSFENYLKETQDNDPLIYAYIGFLHLEMGETNKAILSFDILLGSDSIDRSKALWYKSLAYLKANRLKESKEVLEIIMNDSLNFNYKKAVQLYKELD